MKEKNIDPELKKEIIVFHKQTLIHRVHAMNTPVEDLKKIVFGEKDIFDLSDAWIMIGLAYKKEKLYQEAYNAYTNSNCLLGSIFALFIEANIDNSKYEDFIKKLILINNDKTKYIVEYEYIKLFIQELIQSPLLFDQLSIERKHDLASLIILNLDSSSKTVQAWLNKLNESVAEYCNNNPGKKQATCKLIISSKIYDYLLKKSEKNNIFLRILLNLHLYRAENNLPFLKSDDNHFKKAIILINAIAKAEGKKTKDVLNGEISIAKHYKNEKELFSLYAEKIKNYPGDLEDLFNNTILTYNTSNKNEEAQNTLFISLRELAQKGNNQAIMALIGIYLEGQELPLWNALQNDSTPFFIHVPCIKKDNTVAYEYIQQGITQDISECSFIKGLLLINNPEFEKYGSKHDGITILRNISTSKGNPINIRGFFDKLLKNNDTLSLQYGLTACTFLTPKLDSIPFFLHYYAAKFLHAQKKSDEQIEKQLLTFLQKLLYIDPNIRYGYLNHLATEMEKGYLNDISRELKDKITAIREAIELVLHSQTIEKNLIGISVEKISALQNIVLTNTYHDDIRFHAYMALSYFSLHAYISQNHSFFKTEIERNLSGCIQIIKKYYETSSYYKTILNIFDTILNNAIEHITLQKTHTTTDHFDQLISILQKYKETSSMIKR